MKKYKIFTLLLTLAMITTFTACSQTSSSDTPQADTQNTTTAATSEGDVDWTKEPITIDFIHGHSEEAEKTIVTSTAFREMVNIFKKNYPNVTINETVNSNDYNANILKLAAADNLPDVFSFLYSQLDTMAGGGVVQDITGDVDPDIYIDKLAGATYTDGKIYGLNMKFTDYNIVYYNEKMLNEAGLTEFPKTLEELLALDKYFDAKGIDLISLGNKGQWFAMNHFVNPIVYEICGPEWTESMINNDGKNKYTDESFIKALEYVKKLTPVFNTDYNSQDDVWAVGWYCQGKSFCHVSGGWATNTILLHQEENPEVVDNTKSAIWPSISGKEEDTHLVYASTETYGMNHKIDKNSPKYQACLALMKQLASKEYAEFCAMKGTTAPIAVDVDVSSLHPMIQDFMGIHNYGYPPARAFFTYLNNQVNTKMRANTQTLLTGTMTPEQMAKDLQTAQEEYIATR